MSNVVNLNKFRKKQVRKQRQKQAEDNRVSHGRTKAEKDAAKAENQRSQTEHDAKELESGDEDQNDE